MRTVAPQIKTVEQPVQLLNRQHNDLLGRVGRCFEAHSFQALEPKTEAVVLPIQHLDPIRVLLKKRKAPGKTPRL